MALAGYQALYQFHSVTQLINVAWAPPRTGDNEGPRDGTCDPKLGFGRGFGVCLFDQTNNTLTGGIELIGDIFFKIQEALRIGKCYCKTDCNPSQVVCEDYEVVKGALKILEVLLTGDLIEKNPLNNVVPQLIFQLTNYQLYCYCPNRETCEEACPAVQQPDKCYPNQNTVKAWNATAVAT